MDVFVFGDIGAHRDLFEESLKQLGCDTNRGIIPEDKAIVQVGDLIDRGPDSDGTVDLVERFIESPQWIQLVGNHEGQYLGGVRFTTSRSNVDPSKETTRKLLRWYRQNLLKHCVGVVSGGEPYLITHSGMTCYYWRETLGEKTDLSALVTTINQLPSRVFMEEGDSFDPNTDKEPGPIWSHCKMVIQSWKTALGLKIPMPVNQIHGHQALINWATLSRHPETAYQGPSVYIDSAARISNVEIGEKKIYQVDPGLGKYASWVPQPLVLPDADIIL